MWSFALIFIVISSETTVFGWPSVFNRSVGEIWPKPRSITQFPKVFRIDTKNFKIKGDTSCEIIKQAIKRYSIRFFPFENNTKWLETEQTTLDSLNIVVLDNCSSDLPIFGMDESYELDVTNTPATIRSREVWGALRGLESFSHMIYLNKNNGYEIKAARIMDSPRFPHRGVLLDTSRHFLSTDMLKAVIDLLAQNKFNVFHWHIVDSESFPYASKSVPELAKGAFSPKHQYSIQDIKDIVEFGRLHGIRILPEIDTPGHVASWGRGVPKLLARCFDDNGTETFDRNIFDVTQDAVLWDVLDALFKEVFELFPEKFVHLGADEAAFWTRECWENNPNISTFMQRYNINTTDELQQWYLTKLLSLLRNQKEGKKKKYIIWQELFDYGRAPEDVIVQVWKGSTPHTQMESIKNVTGAGHFALLSSCWYLDVQRGSVDWSQHYNCDPTSFVGSVVQKKLVLGGEAALWGEWVDESNLIPRLFPRASAVAERLWSFIEEPIEINKVWPRLYEMQCRMAARGFPAEPGNGPGFCENEYKAKLPWL